VPLFDGTRAGSLVTRVSVASFDVNTVEFLDLANPDTPAGSNDADDDVNDASEVRRIKKEQCIGLNACVCI